MRAWVTGAAFYAAIVGCKGNRAERAHASVAPSIVRIADAGESASDAPALAASDAPALAADGLSLGANLDASELSPEPFRAEDWQVAIGQWSFADGEATCTCKATSSLLYWKRDRPKDFEASVEVRFLTEESSAGLLFRARGEDFYEDAEFYQFEWYTRGTHHDKRLSLMRKNPYWVQIVTPTFPEAPLDTWIELRVRAEGDHLQTFVDGKLAFDKHDATFVRSGKLGLHVFQPRPIRLRNWRLKVL